MRKKLHSHRHSHWPLYELIIKHNCWWQADCWSKGFTVNCGSSGLFTTSKPSLRLYREWYQIEKMSLAGQLCGGECLVCTRGQRSQWADGWQTAERRQGVKYPPSYNQLLQSSVSERSTPPALSRRTTTLASEGAVQCRRERMNERRKFKIRRNFPFKPKNQEERENMQPLSELCLANICIMHSDRTALVACYFCASQLQKGLFQGGAGYQEETIKGKEWAFKSSGPSIVLQIGSR